MSEITYLDGMDLQERVYHLRKGGHSWTEIAELMLQYTPERPTLTWLVSAYRAFLNDAVLSFGPDSREQTVAMELDRLNALQQAIWPSAMKGDTKAVDSVLKVMTHRAKLLGLDQLAVKDQATMQTVLIVGGDQQAYIDALEAGRKQIVAGATRDDEEDLLEDA